MFFFCSYVPGANHCETRVFTGRSEGGFECNGFAYSHSLFDVLTFKHRGLEVEGTANSLSPAFLFSSFITYTLGAGQDYCLWGTLSSLFCNILWCRIIAGRLCCAVMKRWGFGFVIDRSWCHVLTWFLNLYICFGIDMTISIWTWRVLPQSGEIIKLLLIGQRWQKQIHVAMNLTFVLRASQKFAAANDGCYAFLEHVNDLEHGSL